MRSLTFIPLLGEGGSWGIGGSVISNSKKTRLRRRNNLGRSSCFDWTIMYDKDKHTNILLSLFISMQLVCPQVFGCEWHAEMKAADATNGLDWMLLLCGRSAPLPLLFSFDLWSLEKHTSFFSDHGICIKLSMQKIVTNLCWELWVYFEYFFYNTIYFIYPKIN